MIDDARGDRFTDGAAGGTLEVLDASGDRIGTVDGLFLDEVNEPEYYGVRLTAGERRSTLIPIEAVSLDHEREALVVELDDEAMGEAPVVHEDEPITPELESAVRAYFGLPARGSEPRGAYGAVEPPVEPGATLRIRKRGVPAAEGLARRAG